VYAHDVPVLLGVQAALQQELSGRRNIYLGGTALGVSRRELDRRFDEIVAFAGLEDFIDMPLRAYSSGMVARLHFSIASAVTPEILLIDEALSTGDAAFKQKSSARIHEMLDAAGTVFVVSHAAGTIKDLCTRAVWLEKGEVVADGDPAEVVDAYEDATTEHSG
jgi:teichoic acid transport system ATP-binding protein